MHWSSLCTYFITNFIFSVPSRACLVIEMPAAAEDEDTSDNEIPPSIGPESKVLLARAKELRAELEQFACHLADVYKGYFQEFPKQMHQSFYHDVEVEIANLENDINSEDPLSAHRISSSNIPYLQAVWNATKNSKDIVKLRHPVFSGPFGKRRILAPGIRIKDIMSQGGSEPKRNQNSHSTRIDIICDGGLSWYKISTITNRRLLFDMAKEAVYFGDSDDDDSADGAAPDFSDIPLMKLAVHLKTIAQGHQIRNLCPTPCLALPRIVEGEHVQIDSFIKVCRDTGVKVFCGNSANSSRPLSESLLHEMVPGPMRDLTTELNIDTSILVALISDISHSQLTIQPWFGQSQQDHINLESREPLIPRVCSLLGNHTLVCTKEAVRSLARIVHTMGTNDENARAHLLLAPNDEATREQRVDEFRALSIHSDSIPTCLQLPIRIVEPDFDTRDNENDRQLYGCVLDGLHVLEQPGRSVFSCGVAKGLTTVTSNISMWWLLTLLLSIASLTSGYSSNTQAGKSVGRVP